MTVFAHEMPGTCEAAAACIAVKAGAWRNIVYGIRAFARKSSRERGLIPAYLEGAKYMALPPDFNGCAGLTPPPVSPNIFSLLAHLRLFPISRKRVLPLRI